MAKEFFSHPLKNVLLGTQDPKTGRVGLDSLAGAAIMGIGNTAIALHKEIKQFIAFREASFDAPRERERLAKRDKQLSDLR